jgi:hypothetical protein
VNLRDDRVESYADPDPRIAIYRATQLARRGERVALDGFAGVQLAVDDLLPSA